MPVEPIKLYLGDFADDTPRHVADILVDSDGYILAVTPTVQEVSDKGKELFSSLALQLERGYSIDAVLEWEETQDA